MEEEKDLITKAVLTAERMEKANKEFKELLDRQERQRALDILHGRSEAGIPVSEISPEEKLKSETKDMFKGTMIEDAFK